MNEKVLSFLLIGIFIIGIFTFLSININHGKSCIKQTATPEDFGLKDIKPIGASPEDFNLKINYNLCGGR